MLKIMKIRVVSVLSYIYKYEKLYALINFGHGMIWVNDVQLDHRLRDIGNTVLTATAQVNADKRNSTPHIIETDELIAKEFDRVN